MKSTPSAPAMSRGSFFSIGSIVPGSGILNPQKNSFVLNICMWRGIRSPKFRLIKYNWSTSDFPGHRASPQMGNNDIFRLLTIIGLYSNQRPLFIVLIILTLTNSTKTHPIAQTSTFGPYCVSPTKSSGALYHRVATQSVNSFPGAIIDKYFKQIST